MSSELEIGLVFFGFIACACAIMWAVSVLVGGE